MRYPVRVGEIDPAFNPDGPYCSVELPGEDLWICTLPPGHAGRQHVAHMDGDVLQIWPEDLPKHLEVEEGL